MAQAPPSSSELQRDIASLARALVAASRAWALYPPEHPAVGAAVGRFSEAVAQATAGASLTLGVTPDALLVEGLDRSPTGGGLSEAAALLHDRDILHITFLGAVPPAALQRLLGLLALDTEARRARGGPAVAWQADGDAAILIAQIDYQKVLEDRDAPAEARRKDDVWRAIARSILDGRLELDARAQRRLLEIAGNPMDIAELARDVMAPGHAADGSPMITTQAATVLAAFRRLASIVSVMAPDRASELIRNLSEAASHLEPHVMMQLVRAGDESGEPAGIVTSVAAAFDDTQVARMLAAALATDGQATARLAEVFNTIAPDAERKQRVLTLTRSLLSKTTFGRSGQLQVLWSSMEALLFSYDENPFVSAPYRAALDGAGARAAAMAARDLPPELPEWLETLGQDHVRRLSVTLLIDLLHLEGNTAEGAEVARDLGALGEDLMLAGEYAEAADVARALADAARQSTGTGVRAEAARRALDELAGSVAFRETVALLGELSDEQMAPVQAFCTAAGAVTVEVLREATVAEHPSRASTRAAALVVSVGAAAVPRLTALTSDHRIVAQITAADLLGGIGSVDGVPLLQGLVRSRDPRPVRAAVRALAAIDDPAAARALHTVIRAAKGEARQAVIDALLAQPDARIVPMLSRILEDSDPLGVDHEVVLQTLSALAAVRADRGVPAIRQIMRSRRLFAWNRTRAIAHASVHALAAIGSPAAQQALDEARRSGHRALRRAAQVAS
jgi:hypothetical protein